MKKKSTIWLAMIGFVVFAVALPFLTFTELEQKLNDQTSKLESVSSIEGANLEWNGRNGYLIVPSNIEKSIVELAVEDIESIRGVRNVKIIYDDSIEIVEDKTLGKFKLDWTADGRSLTGQLDEDTAAELEDIFEVEGIEIDDSFNLPRDMLDIIRFINLGLFTDISEGTLEVDGDKMMISGIISGETSIDDIIAKWGCIDGLELDLVLPETEDDEVEDETDQGDLGVYEIPEFEAIKFDYASVGITKESAEVIEKAVEVLMQNEDLIADIIGHTDSWGDESTNMALSIRRAEAVADMLTEKGIDASRINIHGMGETMPIDTNDTEEGRQNNRRVEIEIGGND